MCRLVRRRIEKAEPREPTLPSIIPHWETKPSSPSMWGHHPDSFRSPAGFPDVAGIQGFITKSKLPHKLRLSFQSFPWLHRENAYTTYASNMSAFSQAGVIYTYDFPKEREVLVLGLLSSTGVWVTVFRLETTLVE